MVQTLVSVSLIATGLLLVFVLGAGEMRLYGAILAAIGVLALLSQVWLARQQDGRGPPGRP
jgi:hypothetical protein